MTPNINHILALPENEACSKYGAEMGRRSRKEGEPQRLYLQRLRYVSGDYDTGGAYWGGNVPSDKVYTWIYCAFSSEQFVGSPLMVMLFVRATGRDDAKGQVLKLLDGEGWSFYK